MVPKEPSECRYQSQIRLSEVGPEGQAKLERSRALIVGLGGLGSSASLILAAAGIGKLSLNDFDRVELSNLNRQIVHDADQPGELKTESAARRLAKQAPDCQIECLNWPLEDHELVEHVAKVDIVLDCSDNYETRFAVNRACVSTQTPLVFGAAIGFHGQTTTLLHHAAAPCYACLYRNNEAEDADCAGAGVFGPVPAIIGAMQAHQAALHIVLQDDAAQRNRLMLFDGKTMEWRTVQTRRDPNCPVCSGRA